MKRKLFTLLAAFMALAAFQANADGVAPYDGQTLHYLNVWSANQQRAGHGVGDCFVDTYPSSIGVIHEVAKDYPLSADLAQSAVGVYTGTALHAMKYVFNRNFNKWELTNSNRLGSVGDVDTYFTLEANTGVKSNTYTIRSKSPNVVNDAGNRIFFTSSDGFTANEFTFLRFVTENGDEYDGLNATPNAATVKDSVGMVPWTAKYVKPRDGGYLATDRLPGRSSGGDNDRNLYVVAYDTTLNVNLAPNNRYALYSMDEVRKNWEKIANGQKVVRIVPVWVKADAIGGRWATTNDFPDEFVKFPIQPQGSTANYFTVNNVSIFNVAKVGALNFGANGSDPSIKTPLAHPNGSTWTDMAAGDNPAATAAAGETGRLYNNGSTWELQYFTISNPCDGKLLQVNREQVPGTPLINGEGKFGNKLTFNSLYTATSTAYPGATVSELQRTQQFAIWINENGNMELYPLNSWTYMTSAGLYKTNNPTSPNFNYSVWMDRPYTTTANSNEENFNNSFKIGQMNGSYCTGPVSGNYIGYSNLELRPEKANLINKVTENRYYFIQVENTLSTLAAYTSATASTVLKDNPNVYVLDLVRLANGQKRVVLTPMEKDRYTGSEKRYFDTPYDSVNMSAHWRFAHVNGGYVIINQLGDTLEYDYDAPSLNVNGPQSAYIKDKAPVRASSYKSDVWQTVHLDCFNGYFKLRNMAETPYDVEKPWLNQPYLDTLSYKATTTTDNSAYWYTGLRGRQSATTSDYGYTNHLQKDVFLAAGGPNAGLKMKLRAVDYEYAPGGADNGRTNHSDDGYFPSDDSLCVYLYKEGNYNITEAVSLELHIKDGYKGDDPVNGINLATFTKDNSSKWLLTEPVINNNPNLAAYKYMTPMTYLDTAGVRQLNVDYSLTKEQMNAAKATANAQVVEMMKDEKFNVDSYKWHYIKKNTSAGDEYLVYDTINAKTTLPSQQFGFKFRKVDKANATMFRFYQPLVGDKSKEYFIMEFRVSKHEYAVDRKAATPSIRVINGRDNIYSTDNFGINPFVTTAGLTSPTNSTTLAPGNPTPDYYTLVADVFAAGNDMSTWAPSLVERYFKYLNYERAIRTKFALISTGSDMLLSTWNDGSNKGATGQLAATRFVFTGTDTTICVTDYVDTKYLIDKQLYATPTVTANLVNPQTKELTTDFIGAKGTTAGSYADNNPGKMKLLITLADTLKVGSTPGVNGYLKRMSASSAANNVYRAYENTREVEMYYIQSATDTTLYLTVDTTSLYAETMDETLDGVSGMKLKWAKKFTNNSQKGTNVEASDYRPLQMFAIYGCKSPASPFGNFILIPAASWEYNYTTMKHTRILANTKIGNGTIVDEFRISEGNTRGSGGTNYMIVMPSSQTAPQGVTPTEYKLVSDAYYTSNYFCEDTNGYKHSFVQQTVFNPANRGTITGNYTYSYKVGTSTSVKDFNDPSMHWSVCKVAEPNLFAFTPESDMWDANGERVPGRNQLTKFYYLVQHSGKLATKVDGTPGDSVITFTAIPQYNADRDSMKTFTITRISEAEGDACTTAFKKFSTDDLHLDWSIIESIYKDRYVYSHGEADGAGYADDPAYPGKAGDWADAYYKDADDNANKTVQFLRIRESNTTYQNEKNGDTVFHHAVPYYNIIHVVYNTQTKQEDEYYLEMGYDEKFKKDVVRFRYLTEREKYVVENYNTYPDTMQAVKFCFPYKLNTKGQPTTTVNVNGYDYTDQNVAIRTMPRQNEVFWLGVGSPNTSEAWAVKDSTKADVFFFGPNANTGEEWVGDKDKSGWLKDFNRSASATSIYLVEPSAASPVNYALYSHYKDVLPTINDGKFTFKMVKDTIINKYTKTHIWYYQIINDKGQLLTYKPLAGAGSDYKTGEYTYAYFTDAAPNANIVTPTNNQVFGMLINKAAATAGHAYPFWVVAQAPSGSYKYLGVYNGKMVFIPTLSDKKKEAQELAMTFEVGKMSGDTFTGKENIDGGAAAVYGVEGAVKVVNAEGTIELFTIDGRQFKAVTATGGEQTITAPRGVVIVKVAGKATKVVVK